MKPKENVLAAAAVLFGVLASAGCGKPKIEEYRVVRETPAPAAARSTLPEGHPPLGDGTAAPERLPAAHDGDAPKPAGDLRWKVPSGWEEVPASGMRAATFFIGKGPGRAEMSVISLLGSAGGPLANANRWRGQIGLAAIDAATFKRTARRIKSPAGEVMSVDFAGPKRGVLAGMITLEGKTWFFKLWGPKEATGKARKDFRLFLKSLKPREE